jgi:hypothetical protein
MKAHDERPVAALRVCVRFGRAIAVCEAPPILELGDSEDEVVEAVCKRLETIIPANAGSAVLLDVDYGNRLDKKTRIFR